MHLLTHSPKKTWVPSVRQTTCSYPQTQGQTLCPLAVQMWELDRHESTWQSKGSWKEAHLRCWEHRGRSDYWSQAVGVKYKMSPTNTPMQRYQRKSWAICWCLTRTTIGEEKHWAQTSALCLASVRSESGSSSHLLYALGNIQNRVCGCEQEVGTPK